MLKNKKLKFQRFGKYLILDHIVDGGMAKICRARFLGEQANKIVAIKMVQTRYSEDPAFRQMFEDELRLTFGLLHPNIAQTYDYGVVENQLFTAMEYVDGANLKQYMDRLIKRNFVFPVEISTYITSQVCQALQYAHTFTDKLTGKSLNIIHRDISPHNIMLTYDGSVKVIDFGIAKSESNSESTQAGTIKGKLSYLAPEYLDGLDLDCRYDIFAVGLTFWELLCNRRLFQAKNDLAVLKKIQKCEVPAPSSINKKVPKELDEIVLKALAKDRNQRYENMDKFNRDVVRFLYSKYPEFNPTDLSYFAHELFKEDIAKDRKKLVRYGQIDISPYLKDLEDSGEGNKAPVSAVKEPSFLRKKTVEIEFEKSEPLSEDSSLLLDLHSRDSRTRTGARSGVIRYSGGQTRVSRTNVRARGNRAGDRKKIQKRGRKQPGFVFMLIVLGGLFFAYKGGVLDQFTGGVPSSSAEADSRPRGEVGLLYFEGFSPLMRVSVDGRAVDYSEFTGLKLEVDKRFHIKVEESGKESFETTIRLAKGEGSKIVSIPKLTAGNYGLLTTSRNFPSGTRLSFSMNGRKIDKVLPLENMRVPAGEYEAIIIDPVLQTKKKVQFKIEPSKKHFLRKE